jgi:hypothetical protein
MARYNTLDELLEGTVGKEFLVPADISGILKCDPYLITLMAKDENERKKLGFPVVVIKSRTKIPKEPFVKYCRGMFMIDQNELEELQSLYSLLMEMKSQGKNKEE